MIRRLKDDDAPASPIEADAVDLLRAAVRYDPAPGQKQRVKARLLQQGVVGGHRVLRFRPSVVVGVVMFGAVASAAAGWHRIAHMVESFLGPADPQTTEDLPGSRVLPGQRARGEIATADELSIAERTAVRETARMPERMSPVERRASARRVSSDGGIAGSVGKMARRAAVGKTGRGGRELIGVKTIGLAGTDVAQRREVGPAAGTPIAERPERMRRSDDSSLVFDAVHALRRDGAPVRALSLLHEYSQRHPGGPLAEEALALSVEAATMCGDPRAQSLIDQYRSRYPMGHFRAAVETSRARLSP